MTDLLSCRCELGLRLRDGRFWRLFGLIGPDRRRSGLATASQAPRRNRSAADRFATRFSLPLETSCEAGCIMLHFDLFLNIQDAKSAKRRHPDCLSWRL